jgi:hypothetical protein
VDDDVNDNNNNNNIKKDNLTERGENILIVIVTMWS